MFDKYPEYANLTLYLSGESYAGHFVPSLARRISKATDMNFKGFLIGNALVNAQTQFTRFRDYGLTKSLIPSSEINKSAKLQQNCNEEASKKEGQCSAIINLITKSKHFDAILS